MHPKSRPPAPDPAEIGPTPSTQPPRAHHSSHTRTRQPVPNPPVPRCTTTTCWRPRKFAQNFARIPLQFPQSLVISRTSPQHAPPTPLDSASASPCNHNCPVPQISPKIPPGFHPKSPKLSSSLVQAHFTPISPPMLPLTRLPTPLTPHSSPLSPRLSSATLANQVRFDCLRGYPLKT